MSKQKLTQLQEIKSRLDKILEVKPAKYPAISFIKAWRNEVQAEIDDLERSIWNKFKLYDKVRLGTLPGFVSSIETKCWNDGLGVYRVLVVQFPSGTLEFDDFTIKHLEKVD